MRHVQEPGAERVSSSPKGSLHQLQMEDKLRAPLAALSSRRSHGCARAMAAIEVKRPSPP